MIVRGMMNGGGGDRVLDLFRGAEAAYSLRALITKPNLKLIRVVRLTDDAELDIGVDIDGELDTATLLAFVGAGNNGRVRTWYDQSGNGFHAVQADAIERPTIVNNGFLQLTNGLPAINFIPGSATFLRNNDFNMNTNPHSTFCVVDHSLNDGTNRRYLSMQRDIVNDGNWVHFATSNTISSGSRHPVNNTINGAQPTPTDQAQTYYRTTNDLQEFSVDGGFRFNNTFPVITHVDMQQIRIGQGDSDTANTVWRGNIQEIIVYPRDLGFADSSTVIDEQIAYYNIP